MVAQTVYTRKDKPSKNLKIKITQSNKRLTDLSD